mgnify:CR=1 FL=1
MHLPTKIKRPLSPHLQVYKPQLTSILSILHRLTGVMLSLGAFTLICWLHCLVSGDQTRAWLFSMRQTYLFKSILVLWVFSLFFHLLNGIRHLFWDLGKGFEMKDVYASGYAIILLSIILTIVFCLEVVWRS